MTDTPDQDVAACPSELEELVLKECIVSATGLSADSLQIGIKGDPSLRETTALRQKYESPLDHCFDRLRPNLEELLLERSTFRLFVGFNSGEISTNSVLDPLRIEIHSAERLTDRAYLDRHFPRIGFDDKVAFMREIYRFILASETFAKLPSHWQNIMRRRNQTWQPTRREEIPHIFATLKVLRELPDYYLRNITFCMVQNVVRLQFNCDGTQIVSADNYRQFIEENL